VPKKKNAMALFEAISKSKAKRSEDMTVPGWIGKNQAAPASAAGQAGSPAADGAAPSAGAPAMTAPPMPGERVASPASGQRAWSAGADSQEPSQDVVTVSMTRKTAVLIVLGTVLLVVGILFVGVHLGHRGATVANPAAAPGLANADQRAVPPPTDFVPNKYYLVIEELEGFSPKDQADAAGIADFCTKNGEPAKVVQFTAKGTKKPRAAILSLRPHDTGKIDDAVKAEAQAVEDLGKQYFKLHRDYKLSQHDGKTGLLTAWLQPMP
jgi:hypothetical protein